jgi:hypothetical protein
MATMVSCGACLVVQHAKATTHSLPFTGQSSDKNGHAGSQLQPSELSRLTICWARQPLPAPLLLTLPPWLLFSYYSLLYRLGSIASRDWP